jgi:hypothetical protein
MSEVVSTIMFDGQFWIAFTEKRTTNGVLLVGKYTFGPEPSDNDLLYYLYRCHGVRLHRTETGTRTKARRTLRETNRTTSKSLAKYQEIRKEYLIGKHKERKQHAREEKQRQYEQKSEKRKWRKRGR